MKPKRLNSFLAIAALLIVSLVGCATLGGQQAVQEDIIAYLATHEGALPAMMSVEQVVDIVLKSHEATDGSTTHFRWGDLSGKRLFVVSLFPDLGVIKEGRAIAKDELSAFAQAHLDLFSDPRVCLGTWYNSDDGNSYIDINVALADKAQAVELGKKYNQIAIIDLSTLEETSTGGDGKPIADLPDPLLRLPPFKTP